MSRTDRVNELRLSKYKAFEQKYSGDLERIEKDLEDMSADNDGQLETRLFLREYLSYLQAEEFARKAQSTAEAANKIAKDNRLIAVGAVLVAILSLLVTSCS